MTSYREMDEIGRDPVRVRNLALGLLKLAETAENIFSEWELQFLKHRVEEASAVLALTPKQKKQMKFSDREHEARLALRDFRLTTLQAEKLLEIREAAVLYRDVGGISVLNLINQCHLSRLELDEGDEEFIERLWKSGVAELRRGDLSRLKRCSKQLGHLEDYM
jgi:hypothetical protein